MLFIFPYTPLILAAQNKGNKGQPQFRGMEFEFDQPLRELGFRGVPFKGIVRYCPTSTFMAIVFKDFKSDVLRIDSIASTALDVIHLT